MKNWVGIGAVAIVGALAFAAVASADTTPPAPEQPTSPPQSAPQPQPPQPQQPVMGPKDPLDEVVCKKQETSGSRIGGKKVCKTRREWIQASDDARRFMTNSDKAAGASNPSSGSGN